MNSSDTELVATLNRIDDWYSLHVHLHIDRTAFDTFIAEHVAPICEELSRTGRISGWFYIRYWVGGPHIRIRISGADPETQEQLRHHLQSAAEGVAATTTVDPAHRPDFSNEVASDEAHPNGIIGHATVAETPYEPEIDRYGGPTGLAIAERAFVTSSRIAAKLLATSQPFDRLSAAKALMLSTLDAVADAGHLPDVWLRRYILMWHSIRPSARLQEASLLLQTLLTDTLDRTPARSPDQVVEAGGLAAVWSQQMRQLLSELDRSDVGVDGYRGPEILVSHLHMVMNRLGLTTSDELHIAHVCIESSTKSHVAVPASTRFWAKGSFFEWEPPDPPNHLAAVSRFEDGVPEGAVPLDSYGELHKASPQSAQTLADITARRRSFDTISPNATINIDQLARVLVLSHGPVEEGTFEVEPDLEVDFARRGYPSAGMAYPIYCRVVIRRCENLPPGVYEFDPISSTLVAVFEGKDEMSLTMLAAGRFLTESVTEAPDVAIWVCADLGRSRVRYAERALRFALLEAGHLSHAILLQAAAQGLESRPIGGFFDNAACLAAGVDGGDEFPAYLLCLSGAPETGEA